MRFRDRTDAGHRLAEALGPQRGRHPLVLALPRGGVPVAAPVAEHLGAPLDVLVVDPGPPRPGALTGPPDDEDRRQRYRGSRHPVAVEDRAVVVVDDDVVTGATARAAVARLRAHGAARIVLAVPVGTASALADLRARVDEAVCLTTCPSAGKVLGTYDDHRRVTDDEVVDLLRTARTGTSTEEAPSLDVAIDVGTALLRIAVTVPPAAAGLVVVVHITGDRHRARDVARELVLAGYATLLVDPVTSERRPAGLEIVDGEEVVRRLAAVMDWVADRPALVGLPTVVLAPADVLDPAGPRLGATRVPVRLLTVGSAQAVATTTTRWVQAHLRAPTSPDTD